MLDLIYVYVYLRALLYVHIAIDSRLNMFYYIARNSQTFKSVEGKVESAYASVKVSKVQR